MIVGAGQAGLQAAEALRAEGFEVVLGGAHALEAHGVGDLGLGGRHPVGGDALGDQGEDGVLGVGQVHD